MTSPTKLGRHLAVYRALPDLAKSVPLQRIAALVNNLRSLGNIGAAAVLVAALVITAIGAGGPALVVFALVIALAIVALQRGSLVEAIRGANAPLREALTQAWWAPVAGVSALVLMLGGIATVFSASNLGGRVFGSTVLFAWGLLLLTGLRRRPLAPAPGNALVLVGTAPGFTLWWAVWPMALAFIVWVGVISSELRRTRLAT